MECGYCNKTLSTKKALVYHQKTAKYCLDIRGSKQSEQFVCIHCSKLFTSSQRLSTHSAICPTRSSNTLKLQHKKELQQKDETISDLKAQIATLQDKLENIAVKAVSRPTSTITTTKVNNYIQNMTPITDKIFNDNLPYLTLDHIKRGAEGYAQYALEYPLKDRVACVDYSRRKVKYKDHDGNVITDPEMSILTTKFFKSIKERNKDLFKECAQEFRQKCDEESFEKMATLAETLAGVTGGSEGDKSDFSHEFVKEVCKKTIVE